MLLCDVPSGGASSISRVTVYSPPTGSSHGRPAVVPAKMEARAVQLAQSRDSSAAFHVEFQLDFATMVRAADVAAKPLAYTRLWRE